jgi:hypothetical protein
MHMILLVPPPPLLSERYCLGSRSERRRQLHPVLVNTL